MTIQAQDIVQVIVTVIAVATAVRFIVEGLKTTGSIPAEQAGKVQAAINGVLAFGLFAASYFGFEPQATAAIEKSLALAPGVLEVTLFVLSVLATKGVHKALRGAGL